MTPNKELLSLASPVEALDGPSREVAKVERLAINLRAYAHARGAPAQQNDEEAALGAARSILTVLEVIQ